MEKSLVAFFLVCCASFVVADWRIQRLNQFQQKYNNSQADIIFLLDVSGSVSWSGFYTEKEFIKSLLSKISVQPIASRVSVISFGQYVKEDIDYIDYDRLDKNKCTFTKEFARVKHRQGRATNMNGALKQAKKILDGANTRKLKRKHVNSVIILLTDGAWNVGGSPYGTARDLRDRNKYDVELFAVGVGRWNLENQLKQVAGDPKNVIMTSDFSEFSGLATRIRGDQIEKLYQSVHSSLCGVTCDSKARCSCGTISGIYTCACLPGYYGSGHPGRCYLCPHGTYKTYPSPDPCKPCPANSITKQSGSTSIHQCVCKPGFTGYPNIGKACKPVECPAINLVIPNGKVSSCGKYYQETCTFTCNANHHIANEAGPSRKMECLINGVWSRNTPQCVGTTCQKHTNPPKLTSACGGNKVGSKCTFTCAQGYNLVGANERECRSDGQWSHALPHCQVVTCLAVRKIDNVNINPVHCMTKTTNYNDGCAYSCKPGFKFVSGDQKRVCSHDGTWTGTELVCKDLTPPTILCPESIYAETDLGQSHKEIDFLQPGVIDNSISGSDDINLLQEPSNIKSPYKFPIGVTLVNFTAVDESLNSDSCTFVVEIIDRELPKFISCPKDIKVTLDGAADSKKTVSWDYPEFSDNSGNVQLIHESVKNPAVFVVGPDHQVKYTIQDPAKNVAECTFIVKVEPKTCPYKDPPINGAVSCNAAPGVGKFCTISCQNPYTFNGPIPYYYLCNTAGIWNVNPPQLHFPWPDCTVMQPQQGMGQNLRFFYFTGNCHTSADARKQIAGNFMVILDRFLGMSGSGGCANPANGRKCEASNVQIKCGKIQSFNGRYRRNAQNEMTIEVEVGVKSNEDQKAQEAAVKSLSSFVENVSKQSTPEAAALKKISYGGDTLVLERIEPVGLVAAICLDGQVFETVQTSVTNKISTCVSCVAGSYFDTKAKKCNKCPKGTYTAQPGLVGCPACPRGTTTATIGASKSTLCKKPCGLGYFSKDGVAPCDKCPIGKYQPNSLSKSCLDCPGATVTQEEGAKRLSECRMMCPKGMFSKTGMEPCAACPLGFYQSGIGKKECMRCSNKLSTYAVGSQQSKQCRSIDNCISSPCLNGGVCGNEWNDFSCTCNQGYRGKRCEEEKNECADKPCYGNAACVDKINGFACICPTNFFGKFCSDQQPSCTSNRCQNGASCGESADGPLCHCKPGYTGKFCERNVNECESKPCKNGGVCKDSHRGFSCVCATGFTGPRCDENIDDCEKNNVCLNGASCIDGVNSFQCSCVPGYAGERCEVNIDECASNPCRNGALCVDKVNAYECRCAAEFHGKHCEQRYTSNDFDLSFNREVQGFAETSFYQDLSEFTISFWMKTPSQDIETGTMLSYAFGDEETGFQDNGLVLRDPDHITLVVLGEEAATNISAADDQWHHVALSWKSQSGKYIAYKDGLRVLEGYGLKKGKVIPANGMMILGQEQDEVGRNFSAGEAYNGKLSQFNLWHNVLSDSEIENMALYRCDHVAGNLIAWSDFSKLSSDDIKKEHSFCKVSNTKFTAWGVNARSPCSSQTIRAQCVSMDNKSIKELNLIDTTCTSNGFSCGNQKKFDKNNPFQCPTSVKIRYECPFTGNNDCSSQRCNGKGSCVETTSGYVCLCNDGFTGKNCQSDIQCDAINRFANGYVSTVGSRVYFSCNIGYNLKGASSVVCSGGKYNVALPSCVDADECQQRPCGTNSRCVNTIGSFRCECLPGFKLSTPTLCVDINECNVNNGNCQDKCLNSQGSYSCSCRTGYRTSVDKRSCEDFNECASSTNNCAQDCVNTRGGYKCQCRPGYNLASDKKDCNALNCPQLRAPSKGKITQGFGSYKTKVEYSCTSSADRLNGPSDRLCQADGQWTGKEPVCESVNCGTIPSPYNGQASRKGNAYHFSCLGGFYLIGSTIRTCQTNGAYSGEQPRCVASHCSILSSPKDGVLVGSSFVVNSAALIKCNHGFMLKDESSAYRVCQSDKSWSGKPAQCVVVNCGAPEKLADGAITGSRYNYNDKITYTCNTGYGLSGNNVRTCKIDGEWSGVQPSCLFNSCGYPGTPVNGKLHGDDYSFGKSVSYSCNAGYKLVGGKSRQCLNSGLWTASKPVCQEILCPTPSVPANGEKTGDKYGVQSNVVYDCKPGYSLKGARTITCGANGQWSAQVPRCVSGVCGSAKLVGPKGSLTSPNYPNSYRNNDYCRWKIVVAQSKQVALDVSSFKTEVSDNMEIRDGKTGDILYALSGVLRQPLQITSSSNEMDVRFVTNSANTADGFQANYFASTCGGPITSLGQTFQTPGYPSNYGIDLSCSWQIIIPNQKFKIQFESFSTKDNRDTLEAWSHISRLNSQTKIGSYYGNYGSLLEIKSFSVMYLKFTTDSYYGDRGFRATVVKDDSI